jgi:hypothetical protein
MMSRFDRRRSTLALTALALSIALSPPTRAQQPDSIAAIEIAVVRGMLARSGVSDTALRATIAISPLFSPSGTSHPPVEGSTARPAPRTTALTSAFSGRVARRGEILACSAGGPRTCALAVDAYIELTAPEMAADSVIVDAAMWTRTRSTRQPVAMESVRFTLARVAGAWQVRRAVQLSIT